MWQLDGPVELLDMDETLTVVRQGLIVGEDVDYQDGIAVALKPAGTFEVICTVQPMAGKDLLLVPEAFREKETLWLWVRQDIGAPVLMNVSDIVLRETRAYQVQSSEDWGSYSRCMLVAIDVGLVPGLAGPVFGADVLPLPV